jgi:hypothetical protein
VSTHISAYSDSDALDAVPNSLTNQTSQIFLELGFTSLTSTLLGIPSGVVEIVTIASGIYFLGKFPNSRAIISILYFIPNILGSVLVITLPFSQPHAILGALCESTSVQGSSICELTFWPLRYHRIVRPDSPASPKRIELTWVWYTVVPQGSSSPLHGSSLRRSSHPVPSSPSANDSGRLSALDTRRRRLRWL